MRSGTTGPPQKALPLPEVAVSGQLRIKDTFSDLDDSWCDEPSRSIQSMPGRMQTDEQGEYEEKLQQELTAAIARLG